MTESRANRTKENGIWRYLDQSDAEFVLISEPEYRVEAVDDFIDAGTLPEETISLLRGMRHDALQAYLSKNIPLLEARLQGLYMACRAAGMLNSARIGVKFKRAQKQKAARPRSAKTDSGSTVGEVVARLATDDRHEDEPSKELWNLFWGELDALGMDPESIETDVDPRKWSISYAFGDRRKRMTFGSFQTAVSKARKENSI